MSASGEQPTSRGVPGDRDRLEATRQVDAACDAFERAIAGDEVPPFAPYLDRVDPGLRPGLVVELAGIARETLRADGVSNPASRVLAANTDLPAALLECVRACFEGEGTVQFQAPAGGLLAARPGSTRKKPSRGLRLRCPHCSKDVEVVADAQLDAVDCTTCGSRFSLVDRSRETGVAQTLQKVDRFELIARLGVGGFGTVWKARDTELDRAVAVKIPRRGQLSPEEVEQFLREARSAAQLAHPNIVPVHEVGREGDAVFIVSDLVRGSSLADHLTAKRPTPTEAARLCRAIAGALEHAHQRGVIHRDLKPSNVMVDERGEPRLMDFGLAKREAEEVTMTTDGQIVGTPAYMSPEQAAGRSAFVDRRTDVYSLGVILFELLTGELPFRGNAPMQVQQRLTDDAPNARSLNRHLPVDLATVCAKCLERDPGRRYPTAQAVAEDLGCFLERRPIKARPLSRVQRGVRWAERNPAQATAAALVAVLAVAGPAAAVVINTQRARLAGLVEEKDALIGRRNEESAAHRRENAALRAELDVWEGKANPWTVWPPDRDTPPKERMLESLRRRRGELLEAATPSESDRTAAMRRIALGLLCESAGDRDAAKRHFTAAEPALKRLHAAAPRSAPVTQALLRVYDHLARLTAEKGDRSAGWTEAARDVAERFAAEAPEDALAEAERLDRELRSAVSAGFNAAGSQLKAAAQAERRLADLWPETPEELYRLTCELAGEPAPLLSADEAPTAND